MRFLIDAQLPPALAKYFEARGQESKAARELGLRDAEDHTIWSFAQAGNWIVVTKDDDFAERALRGDAGPQVLWLRMGTAQTEFSFPGSNQSCLPRSGILKPDTGSSKSNASFKSLSL